MRRLAWIALTVGLAGCGTSDADRFDLRTPGSADPVTRERAKPDKQAKADKADKADKPTPQEIGVIRGWADALRAGKVAKASTFFAVPARVFDGTNPIRVLGDRRAVRDFNAGLPCGAEVVRTKRGQGSYVVATFRLTERPGRGRCGPGTGSLAATAFIIERRHIVQWFRVPNPRPAETKPS